MEWYSEPITIKDKETSKNGKYTNYYFVYDEVYQKDGKDKVREVWKSVPEKIFKEFKKGQIVQLTRLDFYANKKRYDFISECKEFYLDEED